MDATAMALAAQQLQQGMHTMQLQCADEARRRTEEIQRLRAEKHQLHETHTFVTLSLVAYTV
jgi:hypothetical protein